MTRASYDGGVGQPRRRPTSLCDTLATVRTASPLFAQVTTRENELVLANYFMLLEIPDVRVSIYRSAAKGGHSRTGP